jgi:hypothetical protein
MVFVHFKLNQYSGVQEEADSKSTSNHIASKENHSSTRKEAC